MTPAQKEEMRKWHVSISDAYRHQKPPIITTRAYEVMRGPEIKAILFSRSDAVVVRRAMARAAAGLED